MPPLFIFTANVVSFFAWDGFSFLVFGDFFWLTASHRPGINYYIVSVFPRGHTFLETIQCLWGYYYFFQIKSGSVSVWPTPTLTPAPQTVSYKQLVIQEEDRERHDPIIRQMLKLQRWRVRYCTFDVLFRKSYNNWSLGVWSIWKDKRNLTKNWT